MKDKINIKMFKPFGSMISEQQLPDDLVKDFLDDLKMIRNLPDEKRKDYLFGHKLAGSVESEYLITPIKGLSRFILKLSIASSGLTKLKPGIVFLLYKNI